MSKLTSQDIVSLVDLFDSSDWKVLHLEVGDYEIYLSKDPNRRYQNLGAHQTPPPAPTPGESPKPAKKNESVQSEVASKTPRMTADSEPDHTVEEGHHVVRAPSLGTFYRSPKPGADPYVQEGDKVEADSEMCLVEVMKLFTTVHAGVSGRVSKIFASDGELVEYDQPLFSVDTDD